ncbi:sulfotransferase [Candidatus Thorarchaeota archaeon]|nr:MAG: sulfotransferase [Candidatus Thorarchaeota archaeon]
MKITRNEAENGRFSFPLPTYFIAKLVSQYPCVGDILDNLESRYLGDRLEAIDVEAPVYVIGLARAGTTITAEMLGEHREIATHRYLNMVLPYVPYWFREFARRTPLMTTPTERLHKDRLMVTRDSTEAVEEVFWQRYFGNTVDELKSSIVGNNGGNPEFELLYRTHIKKLLLSQGASRYAAKNNYNVARMEYIKELFPDAKFVILVRNPFSHIASLAKQDVVLDNLRRENPLLQDWTKIIGHRDLGFWKICINLGDEETVRLIRSSWNQAVSYARGWALYWNHIYSYIADLLADNENLRSSSIVIRYEDLCTSSSDTIDAIFSHIGISDEDYRRVRSVFSKALRQPSYYTAEFSDKETRDIREVTADVAESYGYDI